MIFITNLITRLGLSWLAKHLLPIALGILLTGAVGTSWWLGYSDLPSMILAGLIITLAASLFLIQSTVFRLVALGSLVLLCYMFGRYQESIDIQTKINEAVSAVHAEYAHKVEEEKKRQENEARKARERAEAERREYQEQIEELQAALEEAKRAAKADQHANRPAFSVEAVDRLNSFRGNSQLAPGS